jgi:hypothetical protein
MPVQSNILAWDGDHPMTGLRFPLTNSTYLERALNDYQNLAHALLVEGE